MMIRILSLALTLGMFAMPLAQAAGGGKVSQNPDAQAVDSACTAEAQTAGCGSDQVGTGLMKCIGAYRKANKKTFKVSPGCKAAMQQAHQDHKNKKQGG